MTAKVSVSQPKAMRFRKLRIACFVGCSMACVLLVAMWVRSYSTVDSMRYGMFGRFLLHIQSGSGRIIVFTFPYAREFRTGSFPIEHIGPRDVLSTAAFGNHYTLIFYAGWKPTAVVPYWAMLAVMLAAGVASLWSLRDTTWRFSLRTLLLATTIIAVLLGIIVWSTR